MFTQRAVLLGVVALCFYLVAVVNSLPSFYYVLVWLAVGILAASLGIALLSLVGTTCSLRAERIFGFGDWPDEGRSLEAGYGSASEKPPGNATPPLWKADLGNRGTLNKTGLLLDLRLRPQEEGMRRPLAARFLVEALPSGADFGAPLALGFLPRGRYTLEGARIVGSDVLGLFRLARRLALPAAPLEAVVGPPVISLALGREVMRGGGGRDGQRARARLGAGGDLRGVRPYVSGDDWRHVHWATTARTGTLAVREFEHAGRSAVLVVWDGAQGSNWGEGLVSTGEAGLSLCASLLVAVEAAQTPVGLAVLGQEMQWIQEPSENGVLPRAVIESLALARPERVAPLPDALFRVADKGSGGFGHVFFVSASLRADLVEAVSARVARGETVSVALLDGAAWLAQNDDSRRSPRRFKTPVVQQDGERAVPVSRASYDEQEEALQRVGARVVRIAPDSAHSRRDSLEAALLGLLQT